MNYLENALKNKKILVAAHRGVNGGNIPCNSLECFIAAVNQGADIVELDVSETKDKKLYLLHPGMEPVHFGWNYHGGDFKNMTSAEADKIYLANQDITETQYKIAKFDDGLEELKGKCIINVDKFWDDPEEISSVIRRHGMADQCIVKSNPDKNTVDMLKKYAYDMQYMAIIRDNKQITPEFYDSGVNFVGCEILFKNDSDEVISDKFIEDLHKKNKIVWLNSICYNYKDVIAGDHIDDKAVLDDPDYVWGFMAEKKADIIQTDWTLLCREYLESKGYRNK